MIQTAVPKFTCKGCPALTTEWWSEALENDDSDSGTTARCSAAEKVITNYWRAIEPPPSWCPGTPPAPVDEPPQGRDRNGLGGDSPAGAVAEGQAPDLKALQAEKDRLRAECDVLMAQAGACAEEVDRARVEIGAIRAENDRLTTALAESERKRVEAISSACDFLDGLHENAAPGERKPLNSIIIGNGAKLVADKLRALATPTQETTHVED
ncbi:hypothetical protein ACQVP2_35325 [Methylobacterium aquaticum]|uniref:hypothetical protein n=1 Tax=Methylobacterium aquaticum TaxID=270351 RepID=UPI003D17E39D